MPTTYAIPNGRTVMDATLYTGNSTGSGTQTINNTDLGTTGFKPDLVWLKSRSNTTIHGLFDSVRGPTKGLSSNNTNAETTYTSLTSFNSNGFSLGDDFNANGYTFVGWQWQAGQGTTNTNTNGSITSTTSVNATAGFSIVTWTGTGANSNVTIGHGLGVTPAMVIVKPRSSAVDWTVSHQSLGSNGIWLNLTNAAASGSGWFGGGGSTNYQNTFTSTTFNIQPGSSSNNNYNGSGQTLVAYCWAEVAGFSKFGSYTGNGSADGSFVYLGFSPKFIMFKRTDTGGDWFIQDTAREPYNDSNRSALFPCYSIAEDVSPYPTDFLSNGFKVRNNGTGNNASGGTYIYAAFAENPFKYANAR